MAACSLGWNGHEESGPEASARSSHGSPGTGTHQPSGVVGQVLGALLLRPVVFRSPVSLDRFWDLKQIGWGMEQRVGFLVFLHPLQHVSPGEFRTPG